MKQISILGCGWLGLPLANALIQKGFSVNGSTTSEAKLSILKNLGVLPYLMILSENKIIGNTADFLEKSKILIIDIPPKLRVNNKENFVGKIETLIPFIKKSNIENVLFISSTSVYGDTSPALSVTEEAELNPETESGKQLLKAEQLLQSNPNFKTTVLRFGGLIGEDRHPVRFLSGRTNLENPDAPINLIHQQDCIGIIQKIIELNCWGEIFNAVTPFHPSRKEYYSQKAIDLNMALPVFNLEKLSVGKIISSSKMESLLGYTFLNQNL